MSTVQASLDDSYSSADAQLNLLDLSSSDLMSLNDTSELRNYILAAKRQLEMMQNKRAKTNIGKLTGIHLLYWLCAKCFHIRFK